MNTLAEMEKVRRISELHFFAFVNSEDRHDQLKMFKYISFETVYCRCWCF